MFESQIIDADKSRHCIVALYALLPPNSKSLMKTAILMIW